MLRVLSVLLLLLLHRLLLAPPLFAQGRIINDNRQGLAQGLVGRAALTMPSRRRCRCSRSMTYVDPRCWASSSDGTEAGGGSTGAGAEPAPQEDDDEDEEEDDEEEKRKVDEEGSDAGAGAFL